MKNYKFSVIVEKDSAPSSYGSRDYSGSRKKRGCIGPPEWEPQDIQELGRDPSYGSISFQENTASQGLEVDYE